jgi:hypothetical protein
VIFADEECLDAAGKGFQKFAGIPLGISRIFESLMAQQISANRRKNRSIQVEKKIR